LSRGVGGATGSPAPLSGSNQPEINVTLGEAPHDFNADQKSDILVAAAQPA
jgi:hypothetical protein